MSHSLSMGYKFFGAYLIQKGLVTQEQLDDALLFQEESNRRIGEMAVEKGLLTPQQVEEIFLEQKQIDAPFGTIALKKRLLRRGDLDDLLFSQTVQSTHLGEALLLRGHLTPEQFGRELRNFKEQEQHESFEELELDPILKEVAEVLVSSFKRAYRRFANQDIKLDFSCKGEESSQYKLYFDLHLNLGKNGQIIASFLLSQAFVKGIAAKKIELQEALPESEGSTWHALFSIVGRYVEMELEIAGQPVSGLTTSGGVLEDSPSLEQGVCFGLRTSDESVLLHIRQKIGSE